jgi:hypothetical protein
VREGSRVGDFRFYNAFGLVSIGHGFHTPDQSMRGGSVGRLGPAHARGLCVANTDVQHMLYINILYIYIYI